MKSSVLIIQNNRSSLVYIGIRMYRINFTVRSDPIYPSCTVSDKVPVDVIIITDLASLTGDYKAEICDHVWR